MKVPYTAHSIKGRIRKEHARLCVYVCLRVWETEQARSSSEPGTFR